MRSGLHENDSPLTALPTLFTKTLAHTLTFASGTCTVLATPMYRVLIEDAAYLSAEDAKDAA